MDDMDSTRRVAVRLSTLVRQYPGETMGAMRKRLASRDRGRFVEGCGLAIHIGWVTTDEADRLLPGPLEPDRPSERRLADEVLAVVKWWDTPPGMRPARPGL